MALINISTFKGEIPSYAANLLPDPAAVKAMDCHFDDGTLNPIEINLDTTKTIPSSTKTMFLYEDQYWFSWADDVDAMRSPIARDPYRRVYWTDGVYPKVTYNTIFNGSGRLPATSYQLGVPAPENAPVITSFTDPVDEESAVSVFYVTTYVTGIGEEGAPSEVSARVVCAPIGVELEPGTIRDITISYDSGNIKMIDKEGNAVSGLKYTKAPDPNDSNKSIGTLIWEEVAPIDGNKLEVKCSQMDSFGTRSDTNTATVTVSNTPAVTGANPQLPNAPKITITSDSNDDGILVPSEIVDGKISVSIELDDTKLAIGGYIDLDIANGGTTSSATPEVGKVELSLQPPGVNRSNIQRIKIYRTVTGAGLADFLEVADIPISQATYIDKISDGRLGGVLSTETYAMPPDEMQGLCSMANGICAGFVDNEVLFSEVYLPYAWPEAYRFSIDYDIVAIEPIGTSLVVGTKGDPYLYTGISPENIAGQKLEIAQACVSKRSMVNIGPAVVYACPDGLVAIAPDGVRMATENIIKPLQWRKMLDPSTINAYRYESKYIAVHSKGAFVFDLIEGDFREISDTWVAGFTEPKDDTLYILKNGKVMKFRGGATNKDLTWRSKEFTAIARSFSCCRIESEDITQVSFKLIVDGAVVMDKAKGTVIQTFTLPAIRGDKWQFELGSQSRIESIKLATSKQELRT